MPVTFPYIALPFFSHLMLFIILSYYYVKQNKTEKKLGQYPGFWCKQTNGKCLLRKTKEVGEKIN